jgi:TonB family protein
MNLKSDTWRKRALLLGALIGIGLAVAAYVKYRANSLSLLETHLATPRPPLSLQPSRFSCLESLAGGRARKRIVVLHGADWTLDSTVEPKCFPEREVVMSVEEGRHFLRQPLTQRIRFWIVQKGDVICAKIVESSGSETLDRDALDLVTNHKCGPQNGKNCQVQSARMVYRID